MTGRYTQHSKVMTIANRLVKQGCNRANPHRHALIMKNWQKRLKHRKKQNRTENAEIGFPCGYCLELMRGFEPLTY